MESTLDSQLARTSRPVSVIMPVYNGERFVSAAIESILSQTHQDFEFIIIDDGSRDGTAEILDHYAKRDSRIRVFSQANIDQPATLNRALQLAAHDWVAIIDHDDISLPARLEAELTLVRRFPAVRVVGTYAMEIDAAGQHIGDRREGPTTPAQFAATRDANRPLSLVHPSVLMHRPTILSLGGYDPAFGGAADTELWSRVADKHLVLVVPEQLVRYRIHGQSMSFTRFYEQRQALRWLLARQSARRSGQVPPTLDEHLATERGTLGLRRLDQRRRDYVQLCLWRARLARVGNRRLEAGRLIAQAGAAAPIEISKRIAVRLSAAFGSASPKIASPTRSVAESQADQ